MDLMYRPTLTDIREIMYDMNYEDLALWHDFTIDFMREFKDRIDWREVFKRMYFNEKQDLLKYGFNVTEFDQFCKSYNPKFFKEYFERYFDKHKEIIHV